MKKKKTQWCVYMIETKQGQLYTGMTSNLDRRVKEHKKGVGSRFMRTFGFKKLVYQEPVASRAQALSRELAIKRMTREQKLGLTR